MKKTIRIITFHTPKNYGAVLQAFSLMSYLKNFTFDVKLIDFNTPHLRSIYPLITDSSSFKGKIKCLLDRLYIQKKKDKYIKFDTFVETKFDLTKRYESFNELSKDYPKADYYITGSDQVFNPNRIEEERKAFYLDFGLETTKRIAYAGSFGVKQIPNDKKDEVADYLSKFYRISIREKSGVDIVERISKNKAVEVLDPVFLNNMSFWRSNALHYEVGNKPYLFYYRLMNSAKSDELVRRIATNMNLQLVVMTDGFLKWNADKVLRDVGPQEFLDLLDRAEYVATDSFHGVAFSLIFEKQFVFTDFNIELAGRGLNLLRKVDAEQCAALLGNEGNVRLDYKIVFQKLNQEIAFSKEFLKNALSCQ